MADSINSIKTNGTSLPESIDSPLKIFVLAKRDINNIFLNIESYIHETRSFLDTLHERDTICPAESFCNVIKFEVKVKLIREMLCRDHMKVAFFGRTSNGKSTVINSVLGDNILPAGIGHTTNCFLQVEGTDANEAYLVHEKSPSERLNVESVSHLANALNSETLGDSTLVRIFWPKSKCPLLRDDVVLVDSPGIDVSPNLDEWIDKHCLDADVFVLVLNAESTLMYTEKSFFYKVNEKISKPNIFIINNRWDAAASEPDYSDKVRKQHTDRNTSFLCDELNVISRAKAQDRVFFVSAKEVLKARLQHSKNQPLSDGSFAEGFQHRYFEFQAFERKFEECLSKSAVKTKFDQHTKGGKLIITDISRLLESVYYNSTNLKNVKCLLKKEKFEKLDYTQKTIKLLTNEVKYQIRHIVEQTESKVSSALSEEIRRLSHLVNDFEMTFNDSPQGLLQYKAKLHKHVGEGLGSNLKSRISSEISSTVEKVQKVMIERIFKLIPKDEQKSDYLLNLAPRQDFQILYKINCELLCADFQEDLNFRFSFGLISMIRSFRNGNLFRSNKHLGSMPLTAPQTPSNGNSKTLVSTERNDSDILMIIEKISAFGMHSQTTVGALALGGLMVRTIGWRVIAITCGIYALLYTYERLSWTTKAKERSFKRQYVNHATRKLKLVVDLASANCSHQVQQ